MNTFLALFSRERVSPAVLDSIYAQNCTRDAFPSELAEAVRRLESEYSWRAIWLLLRLVRDGRPVGEEVLTQIAELAEEATHWVARLNLCQIFGNVPCPEKAREVLFPFLAGCFRDRRVIVRAWAITALLPFRSASCFREEVEQMLAEAWKDERKSMQARLRRACGTGAEMKPKVR